MKFEIRYQDEDIQLKRDKGIADMREYTTETQFAILSDLAMRADCYFQLSFAASFAGVQGWPVVALWDETREEMRSMTS